VIAIVGKPFGQVIIKIITSEVTRKILKQSAKTIAVIVIDEAFRRKRS